jgi:hypothetical protein
MTDSYFANYSFENIQGKEGFDKVATVNIRTSDIMLDRQYNPTNDSYLATLPESHLMESAGLIPDFFCEAVCTNTDYPVKLDVIASIMNEVYQYGGFSNIFSDKARVDESGVYHFEDDEPLAPLVCYRPTHHGHLECLVYECAITVIRDTKTNEMRAGVFD